MVKVGINGFGRIGRNVLRAALNNPDIQIVAINDLTDSKTLAHLLKYDSLLGKLDAEVTAGEGGLVVDGKPITVFSERNPASIPWRQCEVDIVIEATGLFTDREKAAVHIHSGGAKRVIISAPGKNDDLTIVMGVNESLYSPDNHFAHYSLFSYSKSQGNSFSHTCCLYCPAYLTAVAFSDRTRHGMPDEMLI